MAIHNDTRGWIMTCISGLACVVGSSIICVDVLVRLFPGMRDFSIAESDAFLSASLSLSFGVMLFSSLFSMLPQSQDYLVRGGYSPQAAAYLLIGLFLAGVLGIRILSKALHHFIPSHVVDCDHNHDEEEGDKADGMEEHHHNHQRANGAAGINSLPPTEDDNEDTPLLSRQTSASPPKLRTASVPEQSVDKTRPQSNFSTAPSTRRPTLVPRNLTKTFTAFAVGKKTNCNEDGPCKGYTVPCGQECFQAMQRRGSLGPAHTQSYFRATTTSRRFSELRLAPPQPVSESEEASTIVSPTEDDRSRGANYNHLKPAPRSRSATHHFHHPNGEHRESCKASDQYSTSATPSSAGAEHHHHVPTNAFLSIGLQTSIAIALHKAPEGFITYATNHANPQLGFAVFMALFIHNITEGFAMSLPLYLALGSRLKAIIWSSFLGGLSQPLGAGVAALWFHVAKGKGGQGGPSEAVYGAMFAVTSGVMASVALSLFAESLTLSHNKGTCITFAFLGMAILGISFALTAK